MVRNSGEIVDHVELTARIKKDPKCHEENFIVQYTHFERLCQLLILEPCAICDQLIQLISFISNVVNLYKPYIPKFVDRLVSLIETYGQQLESTTRLIICKVLLKQKRENSIEPLKLYQILVGLFNCKDKILRKSLQHLITSSIKNSNKKHYNNKTNQAIQNYFFKVIQQRNDIKNEEPTILAILGIIISLWRRCIWNNEKTVNMISYVCFNESYKISFTAIKFFLDNHNTNVIEVDSDDEDEKIDENEIKKMDAMMLIRSTKCDTKPTISRTSKKRKRKLDKALEYMNKIEKKKKARLSENMIGDSSAIRLLNDPQSFVDRLLKKFNKSKNRFEMKLMIIEVVARVISIHQLIVPNFYSLIQRYLKPHQQNAVRILTALVQSCHELVPDEYVSVCIKTIAANFISQYSASEIAAVGMNTIREVCWRSPFAIEESLAQELVSLEKGIDGSNGIDKVLAIASKSLLQTLRVVNPKVLLKKDRVRQIFSKANLQNDKLNNSNYDNISSLSTLKIHSTIPGLEYLNSPTLTSVHSESVTNENDNSDTSCDNSHDVVYDDDGNADADNDDDSWEDTSALDEQPNIYLLNDDVISSRFLTDEEFRLIRRNKLKYEAQQLAQKIGSNNKNRNHTSPHTSISYDIDDDVDDSLHDNNIHNDEIIRTDKVGFVSGLKKKHVNPSLVHSSSNYQDKKTPDDRKKSNAEYRSKVFKDWRFNPSASRTQREKNKSKPYMMVKHKKQVKGKAKKSIRDRIATLRKTIKNAGKIRH